MFLCFFYKYETLCRALVFGLVSCAQSENSDLSFLFLLAMSMPSNPQVLCSCWDKELLLGQKYGLRELPVNISYVELNYTYGDELSNLKRITVRSVLLKFRVSIAGCICILEALPSLEVLTMIIR